MTALKTGAAMAVAAVVSPTALRLSYIPREGESLVIAVTVRYCWNNINYPAVFAPTLQDQQVASNSTALLAAGAHVTGCGMCSVAWYTSCGTQNMIIGQIQTSYCINMKLYHANPPCSCLNICMQHALHCCYINTFIEKPPEAIIHPAQ